MIVTVLQGEYDRNSDSPFELINHKPVARFNFEVDSIEDALELGYYHTQNLRDSWSRAGSADAHPTLELLQPLHIHDGEEYGHRSSMCGDIFEITDIDGGDQVQRYVVAVCGFERI